MCLLIQYLHRQNCFLVYGDKGRDFLHLICIREEVFSIIFGKIKGKETEKPQNSEEPGAFLSFLVMNLRLPNILHNPSADLFCAVLCAAFHLDFGRADAGIERGVYGLTNQTALFFAIEVLEQHRDGEDLRERIGDVLPLRLRPRTVDGLEHRGAFARRRGGKEAHRAADAGAFVREDIAEGVFRHHDVEEGGFLDHAHGGVVDEHVVGRVTSGYWGAISCAT